MYMPFGMLSVGAQRHVVLDGVSEPAGSGNLSFEPKTCNCKLQPQRCCLLLITLVFVLVYCASLLWHRASVMKHKHAPVVSPWICRYDANFRYCVRLVACRARRCCWTGLWCVKLKDCWPTWWRTQSYLDIYC